ncbi:cysteine proteinase [Lojkania enalia]|uniref:ubiquitinyl hydrolase 1 n=1 Tax=Lojkania enalia TaxID=147567 RepID=A0A9P4KEJ4_9PLEO|nr:cysteine proteinase [Didymosphaeria enalia]
MAKTKKASTKPKSKATRKAHHEEPATKAIKSPENIIENIGNKAPISAVSETPDFQPANPSSASARITAASDDEDDNPPKKPKLSPGSTEKHYDPEDEGDMCGVSQKRDSHHEGSQPEGNQGHDTKNDSPRSERFPNSPGMPATGLNKKTWQGFCEIECDPAYFAVMVHEMGATAVTVREVFALDEDSLSRLPQPIYGFILLFRARSVATGDQEDECPKGVWFANQLPAQNSCATLAMLNILMNIPDLDIGDHLQQFKEFTADFTPYARGEALSSFSFVKRIHNSFAKKMDMLEADKHLAAQVSRKSHIPSRISPKKNDHTYRDYDEDLDEDFEENAHHFIAFLPIDGIVWKLDGMDAFPISLGPYDEVNGKDWKTIASDTITDVMQSGGDDYSIIALAQAPLVGARRELCINTKTFKQVIGRLDTLDPSWTAFTTDENGDAEEPLSPSFFAAYGIEQWQYDDAKIPESLINIVDSEELDELVLRRMDLVAEKHALVSKIQAEEADEEEENAKAERRRWDYGSLIKRWLEMLAENGWLEQHLDHFMPEEKLRESLDKMAKKGGE